LAGVWLLIPESDKTLLAGEVKLTRAAASLPSTIPFADKSVKDIFLQKAKSKKDYL
jgi:hypothetical protein